MKKKKIWIVLMQFVLLTNICNSQNRNSVWIFGDSAGINFNNQVLPVPINSAMDSRGSCCSISDTSGSLLFYASGSDNNQLTISETVLVRNSLNQVVQNGDSIIGMVWYQELIITDNPSASNIYYLFSAGVTINDGLYYSIIDMNANSGLGAVIQKNVQLENFKVVDGMNAIKHGNGRDWWILIRNASVFSNDQYLYFLGPNSVSVPFIQSVGTNNSTNSGRYAFTKDGSRLAYINFKGMLEIYDFDRCTGVISNPVTIHPEPPSSPFPNRFWSCEFSANGRFLYISTNSDSCHLYQYDLLNVDPVNSRILLESSAINLIGSGFLKRGSDQKVYFSRAYECQAFPYCYPYPDSVYNQYNMNLSVINSPDSLGLACNYTPYSFYLGGKRTYYGLPNNPDYDLPALAGSPCDTLLSLHEPANISTNASLYVYYAPDWEKAFINADKLNGKQYRLRLVDVLGKEVYTESGVLNSQYFTQDLNCASFASGIYLITFETEKERLVKKMQINWR